MFKSKIAKAAVLILALDLASLAGWWLLYNEIRNKDERIASIRQDIVLQEAKQKNIKQLDQTLGSIVPEKSKIDRVFADSGSIVKFIEDLEKLTVLSGAELEILSGAFPAKAEEGGPFFTLNVKGGFNRVFKFLSLLEKMSYQIRVEGARFGSDEAGAWSSQIKLRMLSYKF